jgi:hypothetical protein
MDIINMGNFHQFPSISHGQACLVLWMGGYTAISSSNSFRAQNSTA